MKKLICMLLSLALIISMFTAVYAEGDTATAVLKVDKETVSVGDTVTVTLALENIVSGEFIGCDAALFYNSSVLEFDAEYGIVLNKTLGECGVEKIYTAAKGDMVRCAAMFGVNSLDKMPAQVGESTDVWTVKFKAIAEGDSGLQFAVKGKSPKYAESMVEGLIAYLGNNTASAEVTLSDTELIVGEGKPADFISEIVGTADVTVPVGTTADEVIKKLPSEVSVKLDNGETGTVKMAWTAGSIISGFDGNTPGEYYFTGNISDSGEYVNYNNLFSLVKVIVSDEETTDKTEEPSEKCEIVMVIGSSEPTINGVVSAIDVPAMIIDNRTMTPSRFVAEALGAEVFWDEQARTVTIIKDEYKIVLTIDSKIAVINGEEVEIDVPATIIDDRTLTPARLVSEALGAEVSWDDATKTVTVIK